MADNKIKKVKITEDTESKEVKITEEVIADTVEKKQAVEDVLIDIEEEYVPDAMDGVLAEDKEVFDLNQDLNVRIQKLESLVETYEFTLGETGIETMTEDEYLEKKQMIKALYKEKRQASKKTTHKTVWEQVPIWILFYGFIQIFLCLPFVPYDIISNWLIMDVLAKFSDSPMIIIVLLTTYAFPFINVIFSWFIYVNFVKKPLDKKFFRVIFIIQVAMTLFFAFYIYFKWLGDLIARL